MDCAWLESGVGWSLCSENREVNYSDFCLGFMHVFFFFLLIFMVLFISASHQFRYNCTLACWLEGKSFMSSIASSWLCQGGPRGILQWMHIGCMWTESPFLPWVGELQWEGCSFIQKLAKLLSLRNSVWLWWLLSPTVLDLTTLLCFPRKYSLCLPSFWK